MEQKVIIKKKKPETEQYEFYTMLPDMEVALPKEKSATVNSPIVQTKPETVPVIVKAAEQSNLQVMPAKVASKQIVKNDQDIKANQANPRARDKTEKNHTTAIANNRVKAVPVERNKTKAAQYLIQAGMYRSVKEADGLKARLALLGFNTRLQKIDAENGLWFRVIIGPFLDESLAMAQQKKLETQNIKGILVKQRKLK
jgi:cell division protein FtsN